MFYLGEGGNMCIFFSLFYLVGKGAAGGCPLNLKIPL